MKTQLNLPASVAARMSALGGDAAASQIGAAAFSRIIDGDPQDRKSMMFAAMPVMGEATTSVSVEIDDALASQLNDYCESKGLRPEVLVTGAIMAELDGGTDDAPDVCAPGDG